MKLLFFRLLLLVGTFLSSFFIFSQGNLIEFNFAGNSGNEATDNSTYNNPNVMPAIIKKNGISTAGNADRFGGKSFPQTGNPNTNTYIEVTITPVNGCEMTFTEVSAYVHRSNTGPQNMIVRSSLDGYTANISTQQSISNSVRQITFPISIVSAAAVTFRFYFYNADSGTGTGGFDNSGYLSEPTLAFKGSTSCDEPETPSGALNFDQINSTSFTVNCSGTSAQGTVDFSSNSTFDPSNSFSVELSTVLGTFPGTQIGIHYGTQPNGQVNFTIPSNLETGTYKIRIKSLSPVYQSPEKTITITQIGNCAPIPPHIISILYDGCNTNTTCDEGQSEILFGNSGTNSIYVSTSNINLRYDSGSYDLLTGSVSSSSAITALNAAANCSGLFIDSYNSTIPQNSTILFASENICADVFDWTTLCDRAPIYVVFGRETTGNGWKPGGNFGNSGSDKNFSLSVVNTAGVSTSMYYTYNNVSSGDGRYATYPSENLTPNSSSNRITAATNGKFTNCSLTPEALSTRLITFNNWEEREVWNLMWTIQENKEIYTYTIDHYNVSSGKWELVTTLYARNSESIETYMLENVSTQFGENIFRLSSTNFDGILVNEGMTFFKIEKKEIFQQGNRIYNPLNKSVRLFTLDGKEIFHNKNNDEIITTHKGMILIIDQEDQKVYRFFLP